MNRWTINGALIFAFQGLVCAVARTYSVVDSLLFLLVLAGMGALVGALLWRLLEQPEPSTSTSMTPQDLSKKLSNL